MNFIEVGCVVKFGPQSFEATGAYRNGDRAMVYVQKTETGLRVTDWKGNELGTCSILTEWEVWTRNLGNSVWCSYRVHLNDGTCWHGRHNSSCGQALHIKRSKS